MGLFSTNRISSISAEATELKMKALAEAEEAKAKEAEADSKEDEEVEESFLDRVQINEEFTNLIETNIQILENDQNVFDTILELDFVESMSLATGLLEDANDIEEMNKAKKDNIDDEIEKVNTGTKEAIKQSGANLSATMTAMLKSDRNIYNKYSNALKKYENLEGFAGIKNFAFPTADVAKNIDKVVDISELIKHAKQFNRDVKAAETKEDVDVAIDEFNFKIDKIVDDFNEDIEKAMPKVANWIPTRKDVTIMLSFINSSAAKKSIDDATKEVLNGLKEEEAAAKKAISEIQSSEGEIQVYKMNTIYRGASAVVRVANKKFQAYRDLEAREIAAYRRAVITCGKYAVKAEKGVKESVEEQELNNYIIGEASDAYVFEKFSTN